MVAGNRYRSALLVALSVIALTHIAPSMTIVFGVHIVTDAITVRTAPFPLILCFWDNVFLCDLIVRFINPFPEKSAVFI